MFGRELSCNKFGSAAYKKVLTMQSLFIKMMEELFPWFNVDNISIISPTEESRDGPLGRDKERERERKQDKDSSKL